jgi:predicted nucleotidyltransferase component of viral defense system
MIPRLNIIAWSKNAPWAELRQIEQDLIISRALVDLFSDPLLRNELRFRGGTAINKLLFPLPLRYSEDIDLVRTSSGPIGPVLGRIRDVLRPWLGEAKFDQSPVAPKLIYRMPAEDGPADLRLKIEINTRETDAIDPTNEIDFSVENPWFTGSAKIATYSREEMFATKLRALLQRNKGRDLLDLSHALEVHGDLNRPRIIECLTVYLANGETPISRAQAEERMFAKLATPRFVADIRPLLPPDRAEALTDAGIRKAFARVFRDLIVLMPGTAWAKTGAMIERFALAEGQE